MRYTVFAGGTLGLVTAYRLTQSGQSVMVLEQEQVAGGLAADFQISDTWPWSPKISQKENSNT